MIAWVIVNFDLHVRFENLWTDVGKNYCKLKCIFGHVTFTKEVLPKILRAWR